MFNKLYGREKEIVTGIYDKIGDDAFTYLQEKYGSYRDMCDELESLKTNGYVSYNLGATGRVTNFKVLPKCKNYFEMEADAMKTSSNNKVIVYNQDGNIGNLNAAASSSGINQSINSSPTLDEIISLLSGMKDLLVTLDNETVRDDVLDDLEQIENEIMSPYRDESKIKRAMRRISSVLEPIKHITTVTTLLVHLDKLIPLVTALVSNSG